MGKDKHPHHPGDKPSNGDDRQAEREASYAARVQRRVLRFLNDAQFPEQLLIAPHDPGSALIYTMFVLVLYREGMPPWYLWTGFIAAVLFMLALIFEPWAVILMALVGILFVYLKSRIVDRNFIDSAIVLYLISGFVI